MKLLQEKDFITTLDGKSTALFTLKNGLGTVIQITNFGAKIASIFMPDRDGNFADIVLGYATINEYIKGNAYFGAICGRYANRIANGQFKIDGVQYQLPQNNGPNCLHGGIRGFHDKVWDVIKATSSCLELKYISADGEEGFPGEMEVLVTYTLNNENEFVINYSATTNKPTVVNLTSHSFFNLAGDGSGDILSQHLEINANHFTPCNEVLIPTGHLQPVKGTPFDFTSPVAIGSRIEQDDYQLKLGAGYDHNFVLDKQDGELGFAARAHDTVSGRCMEIYTDTPGIQLYTGNWLDGSDKGKGNIYNRRAAFCLEAQNFPDAPNKSNFPNAVLRPGETYSQTTIHKFAIK